MSEWISEEHMALLERALDRIDSEYTPRCRPAPYGNGCPGADDESVDFWRRATDSVPAMLLEIRARRAADLTSEDKEALEWLRPQLRAIVRTGDGVAPRNALRCLALLDRLLGGNHAGE